MKPLSLKKAKEILRKKNPRNNATKASRKATSLSPVKQNNEHLLFTNQPSKPSHNRIREKTLVIDLDETLVHSSFDFFDSPDIVLPVDFEGEKSEVYVSVRPGAKEFISELSKFYEIVIFTASMSKYAEPLMALLDDKKSVSLHLFREHCTFQQGLYIKDLSQMGKELRNIVLIDNSIVSFAFQHENGIPIKSWFDDYSDIELFKFIPILKNLSGFYDIRTEIPKFVKNNTFIWMKAIKWFKENLLNINYQSNLDQVLRLEKSTMTLSNSRSIKKEDQTGNELGCNMSSHKHKHQRANNITNNNANNSNDFIKITNNFFYDKNPSKTQEEDSNALYYCERVQTEVDFDNTIEHEGNDNDGHYKTPTVIPTISNSKDNVAGSIQPNVNDNSVNSKLRRSSSLNKRKSKMKKEEVEKKFLYSMKGLMLKRESKKNILHTSVEEKGDTPNTNFYNIFKRFPQLNTFVKAKNKNRSSIESISTSFPHQKFNSTSIITRSIPNANHHLPKSIVGANYINFKRTPPHHNPSCSINIHLSKNSNKNNQLKYNNL